MTFTPKQLEIINEALYQYKDNLELDDFDTFDEYDEELEAIEELEVLLENS
jgi:hypothetical protein